MLGIHLRTKQMKIYALWNSYSNRGRHAINEHISEIYNIYTNICVYMFMSRTNKEQWEEICNP